MAGGRAKAVALGVALAALLVPATAPALDERDFAPLDRKGPKLRVDREKLRASVECFGAVRNAARSPVILTPATTVDSHNNFSWNYERLLASEGIPYCTSDQQGRRSTNNLDIQRRGQYVTYAIRKVFRIAGRRVTVMGHSQGGMIGRLALRFWPDTRRKVAEVIGFAGSNHGSVAIRENLCNPECPEAFYQQRDDANFIAALNSRAESFERISYTEIYTEHDEFVTPPESAAISGPGRIANVAVQEICPGNGAEHLTIGTLDPVAAALALDALANPGPADQTRVDAAVCLEPHQSGYDPATGSDDLAFAAQQLADGNTQPGVTVEPKLRCWVLAAKRECRRSRR